MSSEPEKPLEFQSRFLITAIQDAGTVIRAIDTKVAGLFVVLSIPVAKLPQITDACQQLVFRQTPPLSSVAALCVALFAGCWVLSFFCALRTLLVVDNPAEHITGARPSGVYYGAGLFKISCWDALIPRRRKVPVDFDAYFATLPASDVGARRELAFELMKLVFIRTIKMKRSSVTYMLVYAWAALGGVIWLWTELQTAAAV